MSMFEYLGFCRHSWASVEKTLLPSRFEIYCAELGKVEKRTEGPVDPGVLRQKLVLTQRCERCGAVKTTEHITP